MSWLRIRPTPAGTTEGVTVVCARPAPTFHHMTLEDDNSSWADWFGAHGVKDLTRIWMTGWVVRNTETFQIVFLELVPTGPNTIEVCEGTVAGHEVVFPKVVARVIQLEAPPLPFPE
jgi:hypothetical protein